MDISVKMSNSKDLVVGDTFIVVRNDSAQLLKLVGYADSKYEFYVDIFDFDIKKYKPYKKVKLNNSNVYTVKYTE